MGAGESSDTLSSRGASSRRCCGPSFADAQQLRASSAVAQSSQPPDAAPAKQPSASGASVSQPARDTAEPPKPIAPREKPKANGAAIAAQKAERAVAASPQAKHAARAGRKTRPARKGGAAKGAGGGDRENGGAGIREESEAQGDEVGQEQRQAKDDEDDSPAAADADSDGDDGVLEVSVSVDADDSAVGGGAGGGGARGRNESRHHRFLSDKERGSLGPSVLAMLAQPVGDESAQGLEARSQAMAELNRKYVRVGVHREGTCFFHSILECLNLEEASLRLPPAARLGRPSTSDFAYRNLRSRHRADLGHEWRQLLAEHVKRDWFARHMNTSGRGEAPAIYDSARNKAISFEQYKHDYADAEVYVGDTVWPHVCHALSINLFLLVVSKKPTPHCEVYLGSAYEESRPSVVLYLHDRGGSGHYEAVETFDGRGVFAHTDELVQLLLRRIASSKKKPAQ